MVHGHIISVTLLQFSEVIDNPWYLGQRQVPVKHTVASWRFKVLIAFHSHLHALFFKLMLMKRLKVALFITTRAKNRLFILILIRIILGGMLLKLKLAKLWLSCAQTELYAHFWGLLIDQAKFRLGVWNKHAVVPNRGIPVGFAFITRAYEYLFQSLDLKGTPVFTLLNLCNFL